MYDIPKKRIVLIFAGILFLLLIAVGTGVGLYVVKPATENGEYQVVIIREGMSLKDAAGRLEDKGVITRKTLFLLWARVLGYGRRIKAGEYRLSAGMAPIRIMDILRRGLVITHPVTIPEGFSIKQIAELLAENKMINAGNFLAMTRDPAVLKKYGISGPTLEGYLYPDTYHFAMGLSPVSILNAMIKRFRQIIEPLKARIGALDMTLDDVITLASIVEKETGKAEERPLIASVFLNRLKRGMRLESDPTVIYGIEEFNGNLTKDDLAEPTSYNTYIIRGLPPGPIANPGLESIKAVLYPAKTDYLFFVSRNDGSHQFSKTLKEHNRAVRMYQKKR